MLSFILSIPTRGEEDDGVRVHWSTEKTKEEMSCLLEFVSFSFHFFFLPCLLSSSISLLYIHSKSRVSVVSIQKRRKRQEKRPYEREKVFWFFSFSRFSPFFSPTLFPSSSSRRKTRKQFFFLLFLRFWWKTLVKREKPRNQKKQIKTKRPRRQTNYLSFSLFFSCSSIPLLHRH